jgi:hypothetical protein
MSDKLPCETPTMRALRRLVLAARTSGGTAGPDAELMAACAEAEAALVRGADWFAGEVDCDGNELELIRSDELAELRAKAAVADNGYRRDLNGLDDLRATLTKDPTP